MFVQIDPALRALPRRSLGETGADIGTDDLALWFIVGQWSAHDDFRVPPARSVVRVHLDVAAAIPVNAGSRWCHVRHFSLAAGGPDVRAPGNAPETT